MATEIQPGNHSKEIKEVVESARENLRDAFSKGSEKAGQLKDAAMEKAGQFKDVAWDKGRTALSAIEKTIEERPYAVLGGVFAGGIILGLLLRRR